MVYITKLNENNKFEMLFMADSLEWCIENLNGEFRNATQEEIDNNYPYSAFMENINGN